MEGHSLSTYNSSGSDLQSTSMESSQESTHSFINLDPRERNLDQHADQDKKHLATGENSLQCSEVLPNVSAVPPAVVAMCCCCSEKGKSRCLFIGGIALLVVGAVVGGCWLFIFDAILRWQLVLTPDSTSFGLWDDIPIPIYMEFTLFNVTNADKVARNPNLAPEVVEMGPYVFREYHRRANITWNDENNTVTYMQYRTYEFQPDRSNGDLSDKVTNFNIIATTTAYGARYLPTLLRLFISRLIDKTNASMLVTHTAGELLFDGYDDPLLEVALQLNSSLFTIPFQRFAYFAERNNSVEYDGVFNMYTGKDDLKKLGLHANWNYQRYTEFYGTPCNEVRGSSGDLWPPVDDYRDAEIFVPDLCMAVPLPFAYETKFRGVPGLVYEATNRTMDNGQLYPDKACNCMGECVPRGALNISLCRWNAPLVLSMPHFYQADPVYLSYSSGLQPDPEKHRMEFALNPMSGIPLFANARFQLSLMLDKFPDIEMYEKINNRKWVPMVWFNQRVELTEDLAPLVKLITIAPQLGWGIFFGLAAIGTVMILAGLVLRLKPAWSDPDESAPLLKAEDDPAASIEEYQEYPRLT